MPQCPRCHTEQPEGLHCASCGALLAQPALRGGVDDRVDVAENPYSPPQASSALTGLAEDRTVYLAERSTRFLASVLDNFFGLLCGIPLIAAISLAAFETETVSFFSSPLAVALIGLAILGTLSLVVYQIVLLERYGQTLGKRMMKIRIVTQVGGELPGFGRAFGIRIFFNGILQSIPYIGYIYALVDILFIFREDRRCIHDLMAGTVVVEGMPAPRSAERSPVTPQAVPQT